MNESKQDNWDIEIYPKSSLFDIDLTPEKMRMILKRDNIMVIAPDPDDYSRNIYYMVKRILFKYISGKIL